jgi:alanine racemase
MTGLQRDAKLSRTALEANVAVLLASGSVDDVVVDVRADAYGHGLVSMVGFLADHGIRRFRVSPGITLAAGLSPHDDSGSSELELAPYGFAKDLHGTQLRPVLTLLGEVVAVKRVSAGSAVSYGYTYRTEQDSAIALVGLGYADGIPRLGSNTAHAVVNGESAIVAGRIAMDQFVLDLGSHSASLGDDVTVWGDPEAGAPALRDWAAIARRTPQHVTAGLGWRVTRTWTDGVPS